MEQISLPTKTKIAAWWMIIFGGINIVMSFLGIIPKEGGDAVNVIFRGIILWIIVISIILSGCFLIRRKTWALVMSIGVLILIVWFLTATGFGHKDYVYGYGYCEPRCMYDVPVIKNKTILEADFECISRCERWIVFFITLPFLVPLILLLLDRKNFWRIAS